MDEIVLLREIVDLKESLAWFNEALGQRQQHIIQLKIQLDGQQERAGQDTEKMEQQQERILELEDRLIDSDMTTTREIGRQRKRILELENQLADANKLLGRDLLGDESTPAMLSAALEDLVDCSRGLSEQINRAWQFSKRDGA